MSNNKGITLVALIATVIVLGILAGVAGVATIETIEYTKENKFIAELKAIREKANIINKEIAVGSYSYNNIGRDISTLPADTKNRIENIFRQCGINEEAQENYKYFDITELEKIGIYNINHNVLIDFNNVDIISVDGFAKNQVVYYTVEEIQ